MPPTHCAVPGTLLNANTLDDFKERDKAALLQGVARAIWDDVASGAALAQLPRACRNSDLWNFLGLDMRQLNALFRTGESAGESAP